VSVSENKEATYGMCISGLRIDKGLSIKVIAIDKVAIFAKEVHKELEKDAREFVGKLFGIVLLAIRLE